MDSLDDPTAEPREDADGVEATTAPDGPEESPQPEAEAAPAESPSEGDDGAEDTDALSEAQDGVDSLIRRYLSLPPINIVAVPPQDDDVDRSASTVPPSKEPSVEDMRGFDAKLAELEPLLAETNWDEVLARLREYESLPPQLALLYAIAQREREAAGDADRVAIKAVAALFCIPQDSHAALVIAKRLLRRNPVAWQKRRAPSARYSLMIALIVAIAGALAGYLLSPGVPIFD